MAKLSSVLEGGMVIFAKMDLLKQFRMIPLYMVVPLVSDNQKLQALISITRASFHVG